ncbi:hypothetical protein SAMN04488540_101446 [Ferrimonas sediminum]|uniref:Uncharacterized protein n=1 Tax=Ferrimonas sediminum TaxID=718193 RepID=A0A1G8KPR9_9GAMM|nr:hypothetical protein [Ferrimonas sediminum]SDI45408.1 hypothetical protein SAMN04488540_101446 [Ferrimonas sediminum]
MTDVLCHREQARMLCLLNHYRSIQRACYQSKALCLSPEHSGELLRLKLAYGHGGLQARARGADTSNPLSLTQQGRRLFLQLDSWTECQRRSMQRLLQQSLAA